VSLSGKGLEITKTAIGLQAQLEQARSVIELQQQQISQIKERAIAINERTNVGGLLVEDLKAAEANFPPNVVGEIEETIERSRVVLDSELQ
jgi:L-serine deaminase